MVGNQLSFHQRVRVPEVRVLERVRGPEVRVLKRVRVPEFRVLELCFMCLKGSSPCSVLCVKTVSPGTGCVGFVG